MPRLKLPRKRRFRNVSDCALDVVTVFMSMLRLEINDVTRLGDFLVWITTKTVEHSNGDGAFVKWCGIGFLWGVRGWRRRGAVVGWE
jgi:hypothetical protein